MTDKMKPKSALAGLLDTIQAAPLALDEGEVSVAVTDDKEINVTPPAIIPTDDGIKLQKLSPGKLRIWEYADRPFDEMGNIEALAQSIQTHGQQEPILVRPINDERYTHEVVFGNRRWRACQSINVSVIAIVKRVSDQEASLFQKEENENRKGLSDFAKATSYRKQIDAGIFTTEKELAKHLTISLQSLNDLFAFIRIPETLREAIPNFKTLSRRMAVKLATLAKDKKNIVPLLSLAARIGDKKITSSTLEKALAQAMQTKSTTDTPKLYQEVVKGKDGNVLFSVKQTPAGELQLRINKALQGRYAVDTLKQQLYDYLTHCQD